MLWFTEDTDRVLIAEPPTKPPDKSDLQKLREEAGVSQSELADALGVSQPFVSQCERGVRQLPGEYAVAWFQALKDGIRRRRRDRAKIRSILEAR